MKACTFICLLISFEVNCQIDSLSFYTNQINQDSIQIVKTKQRIDSLKVELDSLKSESKEIQHLIESLKEENLWLNELMEKYQEQINQKPKEVKKRKKWTLLRKTSLIPTKKLRISLDFLPDLPTTKVFPFQT